MLRRLATLCVLLLSLSGVIPAAVACAFMTQSPDCCPTGQPCETDGAPTVVASVSAPCCIAQPAPARSTVAVNAQHDRRLEDSPTPGHAAAPAFEFSSSFPALPERVAFAVAPTIKIDQQQVYLRTGRLRL